MCPTKMKVIVKKPELWVESTRLYARKSYNSKSASIQQPKTQMKRVNNLKQVYPLYILCKLFYVYTISWAMTILFITNSTFWRKQKYNGWHWKQEIERKAVSSLHSTNFRHCIETRSKSDTYAVTIFTQRLRATGCRMSGTVWVSSCMEGSGKSAMCRPHFDSARPLRTLIREPVVVQRRKRVFEKLKSLDRI